MKGLQQAVPLLILCLLAAGAGSSAAAGPEPFARGRPLVEAIEHLRSGGLDVVYSSDLIRPSMRVLAEPIATSPREILEQLLAPHGLMTRDGPGGTLLIVDRPGSGPSGGIAGRVVAAADQKPVAGARVEVTGTESATFSNEDGRFLLFGLPAGRWPLEVRSVDHASQQSAEIPIRAGEMTRVVIELAPARSRVEGVVVTPTRYRFAGDRPDAPYTLEGEELKGLAYLGDDALRAAGRLPGTASGDKSARFNVRGGESNEVMTILDGLEIERAFHLKDFLATSSLIDARTIGSAELLTGGFPVQYGDRMSGVLDLTTAEPAEGERSSIGAGTVNSWGMTEGRTAPGSIRWLAAGRGWYPDAFLDVVDPGGENINPYYYDLLGKVELRGDDGSVLSAHVLSARDLVDFSDNRAGEEVKARYGTDYLWVNLESPWSARLFSLSQVSYGRTASTRSGSSEDTVSDAEVDDQRTFGFFGLKQDWIFRASDRWYWKWGFDAREEGADYDYTSHTELADPVFNPVPVDLDRRVRTKPDGWRLAGYGAGKTRLGPVTAEAGLRYGRQTYAGDQQLDPRVNLVFPAGERGTVRASWGFFHQSQRIDELQVEDGVDHFFHAQRAEHRVVSYERTADGGYQFRADVYWKEFTSLRPRYENLFNPLELFPESEPDRVKLSPIRARARGLELYVRRQTAKGFDWWAGYALSAAVDRIDGRWETRSWNQLHAVDFGITWRLPRSWQIDATGSWHSGWPTTQLEARTVTDPNGMTVIEPIIGKRNAERYPPYHRLDLRLTREVSLERSTLRFVLDLFNVYGRKNVCCAEDITFTPTPGGSVRVDRDDGFWLGRLPSLSVEWQF